MSPSSVRPPQPVRRVRRPRAARARERAQARIRFITGAVMLGAGGATAWMGELVASEHPGAAVPAPSAQPDMPGSTVPPGTPGTAAPSRTAPVAPAPTTLPPTTTTTRPAVTSGGSSFR